MGHFKNNKEEIIYHVINSILAGVLVFLGSCINDGITFKGILVSLVASLIVAVTKFKDYWTSQESEYKSKHSFINFL